MFCYKRGIGKLESLKNVDFLVSSNKEENIITSLNANFGSFKPYNGMYIYNSKIILENVFEQIELKDKLYKMYQFEGKNKNISCDECISRVDLNKNEIEYDVGMVNYIKRIFYFKDVLCLEYDITNNYNYPVKFRALPLITNRGLYSMKKAQFIKFNQRKIKNGTVVNISITDGLNLYIKSNEFIFDKETKYINSMNHTYKDEKLNIVNYEEDLYTPGEFLVKLKKSEKRTIRICFSKSDFDIENIDFKKEYENLVNDKKVLTENTPEEFVEQRDLEVLLNGFEYDNILINTLPYTAFTSLEKIEKNENIKEAIDIILDNIKAVDGTYLVFNKCMEASKKLILLRRYIKEIELQNKSESKLKKDIILLKLWYVEIVNRLLEKQDFLADVYKDVVKDIVYEVMNEENQYISLTNLEYISLTYNAIKIYQRILLLLKLEDKNVEGLDLLVKQFIEKNYLNATNNLLKKNIDDETYEIFPEMIYSLSLSYPCFSGEIAIKILDTIFKKLYTPYGLRLQKKSEDILSHQVYPEYMAHFIKANLRQNGITNISKKISYNLVKELIQDVSKRLNCGINKVYNLKGTVTTMPANLLANAELCRLYEMLT